jgi:hypothetical protein
MGYLAHRLHRRLSLREHHLGMIQEKPARGSKLDATSIPQEKRGANLVLENADLAAQRRLSGVQFFFRRALEASRLRKRHKVTRMSEFQALSLLMKHNS